LNADRAPQLKAIVGRLALVMKLIFTAAVVIILGSFLGPCSSHDKQSLSTPNDNSATLSSKDSAREGLPPIPYDEMLREVAVLSKQAGIANLKDANMSDVQTELRIWKGRGLTYPRCFILRITNGIPAASYSAPKVIGSKAVFHKGNPVYVNTSLNAPHSGWENLFDYLKQHGIESSIDLALDKRHMPDPDSEELVLEMKNGPRHTMAYYDDSTATADGKRAFAICQKIENDFDIHLGCQ
jgi:hypothetical protein